MNSILLDLSGKIKPSHVEVLSVIRDTAASLEIPFFIVGASARDYILEHVYNRPAARMTTDVDIGVKVENWGQYEKLVSALVATGKFMATRNKHRFLFGEVIVDIVPFGSVADQNKMIRWPPEHEQVMSVLGFQEAYDHSIRVRLSSDPLLEIKISTLAGLAIIKLIAWHDAYPERQKDAEDLQFIMNQYHEAGNTDRLYEKEHALLEEEGFDNRLAGIRLLGRDMAGIADLKTRTAIESLLNRETEENSQYKLVADMLRGALSADEKFDEILQHVEKLKKGFSEGAG
jgi:predicted nucleotidyltransferase